RKMTWFQAAEILGFTDRHLRRIRQGYEEFGYDGLFDRRRGKPSPKRVPLATVEAVLELYREQYFDLNVRHFHEKLNRAHQIDRSYSWVKAALQGAGLVARQRQRGVHRQRRARRPLPGMVPDFPAVFDCFRLLFSSMVACSFTLMRRREFLLASAAGLLTAR